jgi:hypothetical protein
MGFRCQLTTEFEFRRACCAPSCGFLRGAPAPERSTEVKTRVRREIRQGMVDRLQAEYPVAVDGTAEWWQPRPLGGTRPIPAEAPAVEAERAMRREQARQASTGEP